MTDERATPIPLPTLDLTNYPILAHFAQMNYAAQTDHNAYSSFCAQTRSILAIYSHADNFRDLLIDPETPYDDATDTYCSMPLTRDAYAECAEYLRFALDNANDLYDSFASQLTHLCIEHSLCPMHRCDYAICFDDDDPECAILRRFLPEHDT